MAELSFNRLEKSGTFLLNATTKSTIAGDLTKLINTAVTFTGNNEVGFGDADKPVEGIITKAEYAEQGSDEIVVTVAWAGMFEGIKASGVTAGDGVTVDGTGGLQKASAGLVRATVSAFNETVATIKF